MRPRNASAVTALALLALASAAPGCSSAPPLSPWEQNPASNLVEERSIDAMNTTFRVRLWGRAGARSDAAFQAALGEIRRVAKIADPEDPASEISRINAQASMRPVKVSRELFTLLSIGQRMWTRSGGVFDITFAPIQEVAEKDGADAGLDAGVQAHAAEVQQEVKTSVGAHNLAIDPSKQQIRFTRPGMKLGILGLAKGYAVQKAAEKLLALNPGGFAVMGGNVLAASGEALRDPKLMCIEHPNELGACAYRVLPKGAPKLLVLAQSTVAERPGHIYNAKSGLRKARAGGAFVAAPDGAWAQAAATAASAMDNRKTGAFLKTTDEPLVTGVYFESDYSIVLKGTLEPYAKTILVK